ncbi:hypothetical protein [Achromobacter aloeverae]
MPSTSASNIAHSPVSPSLALLHDQVDNANDAPFRLQPNRAQRAGDAKAATESRSPAGVRSLAEISRAAAGLDAPRCARAGDRTSPDLLSSSARADLRLATAAIANLGEEAASAPDAMPAVLQSVSPLDALGALDFATQTVRLSELDAEDRRILDAKIAELRRLSAVYDACPTGLSGLPPAERRQHAITQHVNQLCLLFRDYTAREARRQIYGRLDDNPFLQQRESWGELHRTMLPRNQAVLCAALDEAAALRRLFPSDDIDEDGNAHSAGSHADGNHAESLACGRPAPELEHAVVQAVATHDATALRMMGWAVDACAPASADTGAVEADPATRTAAMPVLAAFRRHVQARLEDIGRA